MTETSIYGHMRLVTGECAKSKETEMSPTNPLIAAALAMPKTHRVVTTYADGTTRQHETRNLASAENHAVGERRKIGRDLIDRETGNTVRVVSVTVSPID